MVLPILRKVSFKSDFGNRGLFVNTAIRNFSSPNDQVMSPGRTNFTPPDSQTVAARRSPDSVPPPTASPSSVILAMVRAWNCLHANQLPARTHNAIS